VLVVAKKTVESDCWCVVEYLEAFFEILEINRASHCHRFENMVIQKDENIIKRRENRNILKNY
jgi:hypothetical protein